MYYIGVMQIDPYYLEHHGIKGQKWGVRRWQNPDGSLTAAGYEHYYGIRSNGKGGLILQKGREVYRSSVTKDEANKGHAYVSATDVDRAHYKGQGAQWLRETSGNDNADVYETTYRLSKDLLIADLDTVKKAYDEIIKKDPQIKKKVDKTYEKYMEYNLEDAKWEYETDLKWAKEQHDKKLEQIAKQEYKKAVKSYTDTSGLTDDLKYGWFSVSLGAQPYNREAITKYLKSKGYDGMLDRASMGIKGISQLEGVAPVIVFDRSTSMEKVNQYLLTNRESAKSEKAYRKWQRSVWRGLNKNQNL